MSWADATRAASTLPGPDVALGAAIVTAHHLGSKDSIAATNPMG
eukprot:CAMPEP_0172594628 /NCGR_PEP_ID=MMETSP1068-20121228/14078_1 /TAXON_ID=35684 /ORGANISM="Pseudopedinella elastica, Strain CCMP716" /LENGTH=43 /DNA_ID= /DNA_START= /DNA_END= /DNA_ORIENTATION=